jgi:guanosine-3',5'-bis(diphosphate) 3'-pyrophosphohydrolase
MRTATGRIGGVETFTDWHDWPSVERELGRALPAETAAAVGDAVEFAIQWHGDQRRPTGAPYLDHLLEALEILVTGAKIFDRDVLCAVVLHDVLEDTPCTLADIGERFGPRVAELVGWVTKPETGPGEDKAAVKEAYLHRLGDAPRDAQLIKLADRASNVQTLRNLPLDRQRYYYAQTVAHIVPLASTEPWFALWYARWQENFADLAIDHAQQQPADPRS